MNQAEIDSGPHCVISLGVAGYQSVSFASADSHQDAAYIVTACNAYPRLLADRARLIEALRELCATPSADFLDCPLGKARALLRRIEGEQS